MSSRNTYDSLSTVITPDVDKTLTAGFASIVESEGIIDSDYTPRTAGSNFKTVTNSGAHILSPQPEISTIAIRYTNSATAGVVTLTGWNTVTGELTTNPGDSFMLYLTVNKNSKHLNIVSLQSPPVAIGGYEDRGINTDNGQTQTIGNLEFGVETADRLIVLLVSFEGANGVITSVDVNIDGTLTAMDEIEFVANSDSTSNIGIYTKVIPTGTTGSVICVSPTAASGCAVSVYALYGVNPTAFMTATNTSNPTAANLDIPVDGFGVGLGVSRATSTATWTNLGLQFDEPQEAGNPSSWTVADSADIILAPTGDLVRTVDWTTETQQALVLASWARA